MPETAAIWGDVTSTRENCLGSECAHYDECFVMNARKQALAADVVVVNHHLFFADVMLRDEGLTELLPACNTVILDEAHQLPDTATLFFGEEVTAGQLGELARDAEVESLRAARDYAPLPDAAQGLAVALRKFRLASGEAPGKWPAAVATAAPGIRRGARRAGGGDRRVVDRVGGQAERSDELAQCATRAAELAQRALPAGATATIRRGFAGSKSARQAGNCARHRYRSPRCSRSRSPARARAWIFTSATLAIGGDFSLYQRELGLGDCGDRLLGEPVRLRKPGHALSAARSAAAQQLRAHRCSRRRRAPGVAGKPRPRVPAVHDAAGARTGARNTARGNRARHAGLSAAGAGRRFAHGIAVPFPPPRATPCCSAVRASGKASTCRARRCLWSSSTSFRLRRPTIRCSPPAWNTSRAKAAIRSWTISCRRPRST